MSVNHVLAEGESVDLRLADGTVVEIYGDGTFELVLGGKRFVGVDTVQNLPVLDH
jgi:hypothetical protein